MSMRSLERALINELKEITGVKTIKLKDLREWECGKNPKIAQEGEVFFYLPKNGCSICIKKEVIEK